MLCSAVLNSSHNLLTRQLYVLGERSLTLQVSNTHECMNEGLSPPFFKCLDIKVSYKCSSWVILNNITLAHAKQLIYQVSKKFPKGILLPVTLFLYLLHGLNEWKAV